MGSQGPILPKINQDDLRVGVVMFACSLNDKNSATIH